MGKSEYSQNFNYFCLILGFITTKIENTIFVWVFSYLGDSFRSESLDRRTDHSGGRLDVMLIQKDLSLTELIKRGIFIILLGKCRIIHLPRRKPKELIVGGCIEPRGIKGGNIPSNKEVQFLVRKAGDKVV